MRSAVELHPTIPPGADAFFGRVGDTDFYATRAWFELVMETAIPSGSRPVFAMTSDRSVLLPLLEGSGLGALTTPYTCRYEPLCAPGLGADDIARAGTALAASLRCWGTIRLDALAEESATLAYLLRGLTGAGLVPLRFRHFGNWHEPLVDMDWSSYLAGRSGALRETLRRKLRRFERDGTMRFDIISGTDALEQGVADYETVYARSWKVPEPFPKFTAALIRVAAALGVLRLGLLHDADGPVAAQIWLVTGGVASVLKLAHDEAAKAASPGTVLTALMLRQLIDVERVTEIDFGRGDDDYKQLWATRRRQRIGVMLANPLHPAGAAAVARHTAGRLRRAIAPRLRRRAHADPV